MSPLPTQVDEEMASLSTSLLGIRRASSNKNKGEEKTKNAAFCKKHPKHRQSPGVCSLCLNERLSLFIKAASSRRPRSRQILCSSSTTSSLSSYGSSSVSSCPSPLVDRRRYLVMAGGSGRGEKGISWMTKSRSVAYENRTKKKKTKGGFFFGLVLGTRRDDKRVL